MSILKGGQKYRIVYESKNLASNVDNIFATIKRPDGVKVGPFELSEESLTELKGVYSYEYTLPLNSPLGDWSGLVFSMDEGLKSSFRFTVQEFSSDGGDCTDEDDVILLADEDDVQLVVSEDERVDLVAEDEFIDIVIDEDQEVDLIVEDESVDLLIEEENIILEIECEEL